MNRLLLLSLPTAAAVAALLSAGCSAERTSAAAPAEPAPIAIKVAPVQDQAIARFIRVTGSLDRRGAGRRRG